MSDLPSRTQRREPVLPVLRLDPSLPLPSYAHEGDAGLDLHATSDCELKPGERACIGTGIAVAIPADHAGLVVPRSGRALREGLSVVNAPGIVDSEYRGEIGVILLNTDPGCTVSISRGDKIAQLVVVPVVRAHVDEVSDLPPTTRGEGGFGSTGR